MVDRRGFGIGGDACRVDVREAAGAGGAGVHGGDIGGGGDRRRDNRRVHRKEQHRAAGAGGGYAEPMHVHVIAGGAGGVLHQRRLRRPPRSSGTRISIQLTIIIYTVAISGSGY